MNQDKNDVWYPNSRLLTQHFILARLRSVELGIPAIRATNTGLSGGLDVYGRIIKSSTPDQEWTPLVLDISVPLQRVETPYSVYGDTPILIVSLAILCLGGIFKKTC